MDHKQKQLMVQKINKENIIRKTHLAKAKEKLNKEEYSVSSFLKIPYLKEYLRTIFVHRSKKTIEEYLRQLRDGEKCYFETDDYCLIKEYGKIFFFKKPENYSYTFKYLDEMKNKKYQYFRIAKKGSNFEGVTLNEDDFPVVIRNVIEGDKIVMRYGTKKLNRFFIDNKILMKERLSWPVLINRTGSAILVPGIGCDKYHYSDNHNMFVIKL
jgi:tRNA(Ile)-lysidine synthase